jgi:ribosomal protein L14E/L6E/L27E
VNLLDRTTLVGRLAYSKAGRDKGKPYIIVKVLDEKYVYLSNGSLRSVEKPKLKKLMHLNVSNEGLTGESLSNLIIENYLQSYDKNEEV